MAKAGRYRFYYWESRHESVGCIVGECLGASNTKRSEEISFPPKTLSLESDKICVGSDYA